MAEIAAVNWPILGNIRENLHLHIFYLFNYCRSRIYKYETGHLWGKFSIADNSLCGQSFANPYLLPFAPEAIYKLSFSLSVQNVIHLKNKWQNLLAQHQFFTCPLMLQESFGGCKSIFAPQIWEKRNICQIKTFGTL